MILYIYEISRFKKFQEQFSNEKKMKLESEKKNEHFNNFKISALSCPM